MNRDKKPQKKENMLFKDLREKIEVESKLIEKVPSILDFVANAKYLGVPYKLFDLQKLILKCFYRGSQGNEDLKLDDTDIELIKRNNLDNVENGNMIDKFNSAADFRELVLVWGRRCLSEDAEIVENSTGKIWRIGDLWNYGYENLQSWTYDENLEKMITVDNCEVIYQGKRDVYKIVLSSGHEIEVTDNHPMLTQKGWVQLKDLKVKEKLAIASYQPFFNDSSELTEDEASLLGYFSSSCFDSTGDYIACVYKEGVVYEDFLAKMRNNKISVHAQDAVKVKIQSYDERKYEQIFKEDENDDENISISFLATLLMFNGLKNKSNSQKSVPKRIFNSSKKIIATYLKSLFSCCAVLSYHKSESRFISKIEIKLGNANIARQLQHLLSRFGIFASIAAKYHVDRNEYILTIQKNSNVLRFIHEISMLTYVDEAQEIYNNVIEEQISDKPIYVPIASIRKVGQKRTFDIQVSDKPHMQNFVANGFVCHNSGKDFICSIIALYEAMRLLEIPGGDPYKIYNLGSATPFTILTIANSSSQAKILFREIKDKVLQSEYFRDKILPEGVTADAIHFLTPEDKKRNEELVSKGFSPNLGSIVVRSGHSNSDTLVGISCYVLLLDEIGLYKNTAGSSSGDAIFNSLAPAVKTYVREVPKIDKNNNQVVDENGVAVTEKIYDGKIICLSTPRGKEGIFYDLYNNHHEVAHRLICRAATWQVNPMQSKEALMAAFPSMPEEKFRMEFGAEFSGTAGENFFSEEAVEHCFSDKSIKLRDYGKPGTYHFAHLDPATSSHNYALVMAHRENYFDREQGKKDWRIVVDHIKYWSPSPGKPILVDEVDDYVVELNGRFCIGVVTYDHFNSHASIEKLRKKGVPTKMTPFTKRYKNIIYDHLYQLVIQKKLVIPHHLLLKNEMRNLQRKWLNSGYKVYPKRDGDVITDDIVDALAGACFNCVEKETEKMPQGKLINLPVNGNNIVWRSMQGTPYGVGPGGQVSKNLENRASYPRRGV